MIASGITIGRFRGEFEASTKAVRSAQNGHRDPIAAGFMDIVRAADLSARGAAFFNGQRKEGRLLNGVPDEKWVCAMAAAPLAPLDPEKLYLFLPETAELTLRNGHVTLKRGDKTYCWCEPELFAYLGTGYRVAIRFDATEPTLGCAIFNLETGGKNRGKFGAGEFLGVADYTPDAPQICIARGMLTEAEEASMTQRKTFNATVRAEYRAIGVFGRRSIAASEVRGKGGVSRLETGAVAGGDDAGSRSTTTTAPFQRLENKPAKNSSRWNYEPVDDEKLAADVAEAEARAGDPMLM